MDLAEQSRQLERLNKLRHQGRFERAEGELAALNERLKPFGLCAILTASPYSQKHPEVYAVFSAAAEEQ